MKKLGRILVVLVDIILTPVTVPLVLVGQFGACVIFALETRDFSWIAPGYSQLVRETFTESIKMHINFLKTGYTNS